MRENRNITGVIILSIGSLVALTLVVLSPLAVRLVSRLPGMQWGNLSNVGQTYGGVSALLAALALVGVAASVFLQAMESRRSRVMGERERHMDLVRMAIEQPILGRIWPKLPGISADEERQVPYINLYLEYWRMYWSLGVMTDERLRFLASQLFSAPPGCAYWLQGRDTLLTVYSTEKSNRGFYGILDEEFKKATRARPPDNSTKYDEMRAVWGKRNIFALGIFGLIIVFILALAKRMRVFRGRSNGQAS